MTTIMKNELRTRMIEIAVKAYEEAGFEIMQTAAGTYYVPCLDANGDEAWFKLAGIIPNASEEDGTDGYALAEEFRITQEEKIAKAEARKAESEAKKAKAKAKK